MRDMCLRTLVAVAILTPCIIFGQSGTPKLSITNYQYVSEERVTLTKSNVTYRADLVNPGAAQASVTAKLTSLNPNSFQTLKDPATGQPIKDTLTFAPVPASSQVTSSNTFTILVDRAVHFAGDFSDLQWTFNAVPQAPVANAGPNQAATVGHGVTLNGTGSTNPSGTGTLTYSWAFTSRPGGSTAVLTNPTTSMPTFVPDVAGSYVIALTVSNGAGSDTASVTVSTTTPPPPVANAGADQKVKVGATVFLNGGGSTSGSGNPLTYAWTLIAKPAGSTATLSGANTVSPTFVMDKAGTYQAQLVVNDGIASSAPSTVTITTDIVKPVANAGPDQLVNAGNLVQLNGAGSTDANGLPLTYKWSLIALPPNSQATLNLPNSVNPAFTADMPGTYTAQLIVNNGTFDSAPSTVTITTNPPLKPTANAGPNQTVNGGGTIVTLNGSGTDPQNLPLTFHWVLINKPQGSAATLSSATIPNPAFSADLAGTYVAQLIVNNGFQNSDPSTVTISTTCAPPTANAGANQTVFVGASVALDGSASGDACRDPLTYSWSFTTRPAGSGATLFGASTATPTFLGDVAGTYVVQLIVNNGVNPSTPATVTITVNPKPTITLTPNPLPASTAPVTLTVTLSAAAGASGQVINLASSDTSIATVPATVTVPSGATSTTVQVTPGALGSTTITASANNYVSGTVTVTVANLVITVPATTSVNLGQSTTFAVTLAAPAPGPVTVTLTSSDPTKVTVPASITIAAGATAPATQPQVTGAGIGSATITASASGYSSGNGTVTVPAPAMNFSGSPLSLTVGNTANLTLTLTGGVAPAGGLTVTLASSDPSKATVPSTVNFTAGAASTTVPVTGVAAGSTTITASVAGIAPATATATVTSDIILPANLTLQPGQQVDYNVALAHPAPAGGVLITLTVGDTSIASLLPTNVLIPQGQTQPSRMPQLTGIKAGSTPITASAFGFHSTTQSVQVIQSATISFSPNTLSFNGPGTQNLTLNLSIPAPSGGLTVNISSDNPAVATTPAAVTFAQNTQSVSVPVTAVAAGATTIRASALPTIAETTAGVTVAGGKSISVASTSVGLGLQANLQVALAQAAPAGGVTVTLTSSDPSKVIVPGTVTIPAGQTVPATLPQVTGAGIGSAIITASSPGYSSGTGTVTVSATMSFAGSPLSVAAGSTGSLTLNLNGGQAPAGGLTVTLASSDATKATVPATVTIAAGATSATVPVTGVAAGGPVTITASAAGIPSATATVNVTQLAITVQDTTVGLGLSAPLTLTLLQPAPAGGLTVNLASSDTTKVTVPATVSVAAGASTAPVQVTGTGIGSATITATATGYTAGSGKVTVTAPAMSFTPANLSVGIGATNNLTLTLTGGQAPSGGLTVNLSSSDTSKATVPATVNFAAGASSASVTVTGVAAGSATITASATGIANATAAVTVTSGVDIILPLLTIPVGQTVPLMVTLANPAPAGGVLISLNIADPSVASLVQSNVSIPQGATQPANPPQVTGVKAGSTTITASSFGFKTATQTLQVIPPATLSFSPNSLTLNGNGTLTLNLSTAAPAGGLTVNLSSSNPSAGTVPATATFAQGTQSVPVPVTAVGNGTTTIHASALPGIADTTATVTFVLQSVQVPATTSVNLGQSTDFAVTLSKAAPAGGVTVTLASSDPSKVTVPASVSIAAGATTPAVQPQVTGAGIGSATITASASGYGSATGTVTVPAPGMAFSGSPLTVLAGATGNLTLNLTGGQAPAGGLTVTLVSSNTGVATVPPTVTFAAGSTSVTVPATGVSQGTATITATAPGIAPATATVNVSVIVLPSILVPVTTSVQLGQSAPFAVSVSSAPASDLTIALASDNAAVTLSTPTVVIPAGQTTPAVQPQVTGAGIGSAHISASASGYTQGVGVVNVPAPSLKFAGNLTLIAGAQGNLTLTLTGGQAPSGGLTVTLNSDNTSAATVPATISFPAGASSVLVPVTAGLVQSTQTANITASAAGIAPASAVVTVNPAGGISVSSATVGTNQSATLTITLPGPAASDVNVALSSSDSSKATVPASVTIASGATSTTATVSGLSAGTVTITAAAPGFGTGTGSVTVTPLVLTAADLTVTSGAQGTLNLTLTGGQAPAGGLTVNLSSDNTSVATVAPTATFAAGATTATAQVTGGPVTAQQTANITATATGLSATSKVTVTPLPTITVAPVSLGLGQTANLQVTLAQAAPSDLTVTLASSDATKVTVSPATITILKGATSPATAPQVTGQGIGTANITASAPGYAAGTGAVTVTAPTMTLTPATLTVNPGSTGTLTLTLTGGQAPSPGGLTVNLASSSTAVATVPATVTVAAGATTATVTVTGVAGGTATITASAPNIADATATVNVPIQISVQNTSTGLGLSTNLQITLAQAAAADVTINLASSDASKVAVSPATVTILKGATSPATAPQVTGLIAGSTATITASATGFLSGTGTVTVTPPAAALTGPASISVSGTPVNFVLTLTGGKAPPAGLTFSLSSSDATKATVPATVTLPAGATTVNVPVTGVAAGGPVTITASAPGIANATATFNVVNLALSLPANTPVGLGQTAPLIVTVSQAPSSNLTVTLASSASAIAAVPASVVIPAGATSAQTTVTGNGLGSATITASAAGYTAGTGNVTVSVGISIAPSSLTISGAPNTGTLTVSLTGGQAPASGFSVSLSSSNTGIATVPPSVSFPAGTSSANVTVTSVSVGGPVTITASAPGVTPATASVTVAPVTCTGCPTFTVPNASVGQNLQTPVIASLGQPAGPGGVDIKVTSSDANKVLVSSNQLLAGAQSVTIHANQGDTSVGFIVQGLDKTGSATVTVSAPGYLSGTGTITLTPSGFLMSGPLGASSFTTNVGAPATPLTLNAARLDSSLNFVEFQEVRAGFTASVVITSSTPSVGTATSPVAFSGGDNSQPSQFTPDKNNAGTTTLTAVAPTGFSQPASGATVTAIVNQAGISCGAVSVGLNLQITDSCSLQGGQAASGQAVTVTSNDTSKILLAPSPDGVTCTAVGAGSITINTVGSQNVVIPPFCVYGTSKTGSATFTVQTAGFASGTGTVTLGPSGIIIAGPTGIGAPNFFALNPSTPINVVSALLDASGNYVSTQALAGGLSASVNVTSADNNVGTISTSPVTIAGGSAVATTQFIKGNPGSTVLSVSTPSSPAGFNTPAAQFRTVTATVPRRSLNLTVPPVVGQNLETQGSVSVLDAAPAGGLPITLTSKDPSQLLLSATSTGAGSASITVTIPAGSTSASYYVQSPGGIVTRGLTLQNNTPTSGSISWGAFSITSNGTTFNIAAGNTNSPFAVWNPGATILSGVSTFNSSQFLIAANTGGVASIGSSFDASSPGFDTPPSAQVQVVPSGIVFSSQPFLFATAGTPQPIPVFTAALDPTTNNFVELEALRGGVPDLQVSLNNSNPSAGTISSPVNIVAGSSQATAQFTGVTSGQQTNITATTPPGFTTPNNRKSVQVFVQ